MKEEKPMECPRCHGLMQNQTYIDPQDESGIISIVALRCLNCGEVVDPVILRNRDVSPAPMNGRARLTHKTILTRSQ